ncbi:unnamed protein product [Victoria cruziana]
MTANSSRSQLYSSCWQA